MAACGRVGYDASTDAGVDASREQLLAGCAVYLPLDEAAWTGAAGEVTDVCGGHHGRAVGGATTVDDLERGRVGVFPGGAGCVVIADQPSLHPSTALTLSAWLRPTGLDGDQEYGIISKRRDYLVDTVYSLFVWTQDRLWADLASENDRFSVAPPAVADTWQQVTVVYDGARPPAERVAVYRDGGGRSLAADADATLPDLASGLHVGCLPLGQPAQGFVGALDDVVIWHRALTDGEVEAWHHATRR